MRRLVLIAASLLVLAPLATRARAGISLGATITDEGLRSFYLAVGDYYDVPEREIIVVHEHHIPQDEVPVVFFLASHCHQPPDVIVKMRLAGSSWIDIAWHFGLGTDVFYVPLDRDPGPPYGKAYGHFKKAKRGEWRRVRLADADVVNFVNLRFISEHYGYSPYEVTRLRANHSNFARVAGEVRKAKESKAVAEKSGKGKSSEKGGKDKQGQGKGKGKK